MNINTIELILNIAHMAILIYVPFGNDLKGYSNAVHEPISIENNRVPVLIVTYVNESALYN